MLPTALQNRLLSLDVFRGLTVASMIVVNNQAGTAYAPLEHVPWHGWSPTDLVFPFFLWMIGISITFSFAKRVERGDDKGKLLQHTARRGLLIFLIGLLLAGFPYYNLSTIRIPGVLTRIAICYVAAAAIFLYTRPRVRLYWLVGLLAVYWAAMAFYPVPGYGRNVTEPIGNFGQYLDNMLFSGHMWSHSKVWDPEGLWTTLPAIATTLFGTLAGEIIRSQRDIAERTSWLFLFGCALTFLGQVLATWQPINKALWTVSFCTLTAGLAFLAFGCCFWLIDGRGWRRWLFPFIVLGTNALFAYVLSGFLARLLGMFRLPNGTGGQVSLDNWIYGSLFAPFTNPAMASLLYSLSFLALCYVVVYVLYRRGWFLRF